MMKFDQSVMCVDVALLCGVLPVSPRCSRRAGSCVVETASTSQNQPKLIKLRTWSEEIIPDKAFTERRQENGRQRFLQGLLEGPRGGGD